MSSDDRYQPNTTFTKRPKFPQIASYIVFTLQTVLFYLVILINFQSSTSKTVFCILYTLSLIMLIVSTIVSSYNDPSDTVMIQYKNGSIDEFQQFRKTYQGKLLFCDFCQSYVQPKSRHCKVCDRCAQNFDHHCMWINNCVGGSNYRQFLIMILSAFSNLLTYVISLIFLTIEGHYVDFKGKFIAAWISGVINSIFVILLVNLIILHFYLIYKGISTYEFIMLQRAAEQMKKRQQMELQATSSQNANINNLNEGESGKQQTNGQFNLEKPIQQINNVLHVRNKQKQMDIISSPKNNSQHAKIQFVKFGEKNITEKSEEISSQSHEPPKSDFIEIEVSDDESIMQLSQFFIKNKSLKYIIGGNEYYKPRKLRSIHGDDQIKRQNKSKSMVSIKNNSKEQK